MFYFNVFVEVYSQLRVSTLKDRLLNGPEIGVSSSHEELSNLKSVIKSFACILPIVMLALENVVLIIAKRALRQMALPRFGLCVDTVDNLELIQIYLASLLLYIIILKIVLVLNKWLRHGIFISIIRYLVILILTNLK